MRIQKLFLFLLLIVFSTAVYPFSKPKQEIETAYIYLLSKHIKWDQHALKRQKNFIIGVLDEDGEFYRVIKKKLEGLEVKFKPIRVLWLKSASQIEQKQLNILVVRKSFLDELEWIYRTVPNGVLLVTENMGLKFSMIDLYEDDAHRIKIRINRSNITKHHLDVDKELLLVGGSSVSVSKLYKASLEEIRKEAKKLQLLQTKNRQLSKELQTNKHMIEDLKKKIEIKKQEYQKAYKELKQTQKKILQKTKELEQKSKRIDQLKSDYEALQKTLKKNEELIERSKLKLQQQSTLIENNKKLLFKKYKELFLLDQKIKQQEKIAKQQQIQIQKQQISMMLLGIIIGLLIVFALYFYLNKLKFEKLNEELKKAKEEAEYANRSKSVFLANMSHELRTPLNAILGFSELLMQNENFSKGERKILRTIYNSGVFLLSLINDILDIAKIESGKITIEKSAANLTFLINDTVSLLYNRAEEKGLSIVTRYLGDIPECMMIDEKKVREILINYLSNAIKYSSKGKIEIVVEVFEKDFIVQVKDQGRGISQEDLKIIFEPFTQVGDASSKTGTGLGLSITKQFAEAMGGEVGVESEEGRGSEFWVRLPYEKCSAKEQNKPTNSHLLQEKGRSVVGIAEKSKTPHILIVEDKENNILLLQEILKIIGIDPEVARDGEEAIKKVQKEKFDLIFMDIRLPKQSGIEVIKEIRKFDKNVIIVALSASTYEYDTKIFDEIGVDAFLSKPYKSHEIYDALWRFFKLDFIYKEKKDAKKRPVDREKLASKLSRLDQKTLQELNEKIILLSAEDMQEVLDKIAKMDKELYEMLQQMINDMNYMEIMESLKDITGD